MHMTRDCIFHRAKLSCWKYRTMMNVQLGVGFEPAFIISHLNDTSAVSLPAHPPLHYICQPLPGWKQQQNFQCQGREEMVEDQNNWWKRWKRLPRRFRAKWYLAWKVFLLLEFARTPIHLTVTPIKLRCKSYVCISDVKAKGVSLKPKNSKVVPLTSRVLLVLSLTQLCEFCLFYQRIIYHFNSQSYTGLLLCHVMSRTK